MKRIFVRLFLLFFPVLFYACNSDLGDFQKNVADPSFVLFEMFKNEPALDEIWDVLDQTELNNKMAEMIKDNKEDFVVFSRLNRDIMEDAEILPLMLGDTRNMVGLMNTTTNRFRDTIAQGSFYNQTPAQYRTAMFALADRLRREESDKELTDSILSLARTVTAYMINTKQPDDLKADMDDLIENINDLERDDFILLAKNLGKAMGACSYPMWLEDTEFDPASTDGLFGNLITNYSSMTSGSNSGLGNAVKGNHALLTGLRDRVGEKISDRDLVYDLIGDLRETLLEPGNAEVIKDLVYTLEDHFTVGGAIYGAATDTSNEDDVNTSIYNTKSENIYSDTELTNTLRETLAAQLGLLLREDRCGALTPDKDSKSYPLERFAQRLKDTGIDWKNAKIEESLFDIITVDPYGRDRRLDYELVEGPNGIPISNTTRKPYAISFIEDFFFLGGITNNWGWKDGGSKNETTGTSSYPAVCNEHGHGEPTNYPTLNDSLFSITSQKDQNTEGMLKYFGMAMGTYELALELESRSEHIFRSKNSFTFSGRSGYRFYYDQNCSSLDFVTGGAVGDLGLPTGGTNVDKDGNVIPTSSSTAPDTIKNNYRPYNGNGIDEKALAPWTLGWVSRACFEGEGPYYYYDRSGGTFTIPGSKYSSGYYKCMRPNGKIYAYVHFNGTTPDDYIYAKDGSWDTKDSSLPEYGTISQRENRYRHTWNTDYYMIVNKSETKGYTPADMSGNATTAGCLTYNELIDEFDPIRACSSQEEAIFRNYQWVMTEKKFVIIIPMWIYKSILGVAVIQTPVFQILESHGFAGSASARKLRGNGIWAKANTGGVSKIPGDYRMFIKATPINYDMFILGMPVQVDALKVDEAKVYDDTLGFGPAVYSAVFHALAPLYRLGFPRSPLYTQADYATGYGDGVVANMKFEHYQLGSKQFEVSESNHIWQKRNMVLPLLGALVNVIHESGTPSNNTVANFLDGLTPLLKPLFFYNNDIDNGVCKRSLLPRVTGGATTNAYNYTHSKALIPEQFITGFEKYTYDEDSSTDNTTSWAWFGGWAVRDYYMAAPMTTLFSSLVDRKPIVQGTNARFSNMTGRSDGLLGMLTKYNINQPRSTANQSPTRIISNLVDQMVKLSDIKYDDKAGINYTAADFDNSQYANWGARRRILYGLEQMMSAGKMEKAPYIEKLQELSKGSDVAYGGTASKNHRIPEWIFQKRDVDIDMDEILERVVGFNDPDGTGPNKGKGLAAYPDDKPAYADWTDFDDTQEDLADLVDDLLVKDASYNITDDALDIVDICLSKKLTDDEITSFMYTNGKLFAWYDTGKLIPGWVWQGEEAYDLPDDPAKDFAFTWRMIKNYLPKVHEKIVNGNTGQTAGENYMSFLKLLSYVLKEDGLAPFVMDVTLSADTDRLVDDIYEFLGEDFVTGKGSMWMTLSDLMDDLADNVESTTPETVADIYEAYGFQRN